MNHINNQNYLNKIQSDILTIMDEVDRVCRQNSLRYYLIGGTLLGAVRHGGFIPWDDDLDIVMPREDFEQFLEIANKELAPKFYLNWISTNPKYWALFPKVCMRDTVFDEGKLTNCEAPGIFVDIFPLDLCGGYDVSMERNKSMLKRLHYISAMNAKKAVTWKDKIYKGLAYIIPNSTCYKLQIETCTKVTRTGCTHYANFCSQYALIKQTMPVEWFGEGCDMRFRDRTFKAPKEYLKVLISIFGDTYNQLPPEEKRRCHYPVHVKFEDGSEMNFDSNLHKVTLSEQETF